MSEEQDKPQGKILRKPDWLKVRLATTSDYDGVKAQLQKYRLHTICESGNCPNQGECWATKTATFMILGDVCTRNCKFCNVNNGKPLAPDPSEPDRIVAAVKALGIRHCVLTSVTRDDLEDGGAAHWYNTIHALRHDNPHLTIEALIPDFKMQEEHILKVVAACPDVLSHNLETVERLSPTIRVHATYRNSLEVIRIISNQGMRSKSGLMVGLGETDEELEQSIRDLAEAGCKVLTIGQYLQPSRNHWPVERYVHPHTFRQYREFALSLGFEQVESAPLVRSSFHAEKHITTDKTDAFCSPLDTEN